MQCRYCNEALNNDFSINYGKIPMTPNAIEKGVLLDNDGKFYEYTLEIVICKKCGLIQQYDSPNPDILYFRFKNEIIGEKWTRHFQQFSDFILNSCKTNSTLLEVGAGDLSLANMLLERGIDNITVVEKNIDAKNVNSKITFYFQYLEEITFTNKFDIVYSSHVFEHISNIKDHVKKVSEILQPNGKFIFSLPNFRKWIDNFNLNAFNQEHPIYPVLENIENILLECGLNIKRFLEFEDHSLFIESELIITNSNKKNVYINNKKLLNNFKNNLQNFTKYIEQNIPSNQKIYVFGANSSTQILLKNYLITDNVVCILDNASIKENRYLYGFNYIVKKPDILKNEDDSAVVLVFTGSYIDEIKHQIMSLSDKVKIITMNDFKNQISTTSILKEKL